ncbi:MAG: SMC-Scp complex subunit ScpB, partial [Candidatus Poribacteria bacterium]|nr:SMC-Scp complex subunit ScpB [Candidatus Poribacteria bacterium]
MDSEYVTAVDPVEEPGPISMPKPKSILEAILFAASEPISVDQFQAVLPELDKRAIRRELDELRQDYQEMRRSFRLVEIANG